MSSIERGRRGEEGLDNARKIESAAALSALPSVRVEQKSPNTHPGATEVYRSRAIPPMMVNARMATGPLCALPVRLLGTVYQCRPPRISLESI